MERVEILIDFYIKKSEKTTDPEVQETQRVSEV